VKSPAPASLHSLQAWLDAFAKHNGAVALNSSLLHTLQERYGEPSATSPLLTDRAEAYHLLLTAAASSATARFDVKKPVAVVASPGRDRLFQGHTDSPGLGTRSHSLLVPFSLLRVYSALGIDVHRWLYG
jgi:hypothetical protein